MKGPTSFGQLLTAAIAFSSTASAWPRWLPDIDALVVRQDTASGTAAPTETAKPTATASKSTGPITTNLNTGGQTDTASATATGTDSGTGTDSPSDATTSHTTYSAGGYAGGVSMITPATTTTNLYRIGETITWKWNYTAISGTPSAVDVVVSCSAATQTWSLTSNMSYEQTRSYTWDTNAYRQTAVQNQLLTEEYTLIIFDAAAGISATAEAGYLGVASPLTFGMYSSRPYSNLSDWNCVTCSAGNGDLDRKALGFAVAMATITCLSFTWFVTGFGALL